jgi:hypothetical protein
VTAGWRTLHMMRADDIFNKSLPQNDDPGSLKKASSSGLELRLKTALRWGWLPKRSSTNTSASRPSGVACQANSSHQAAAYSVGPKQGRMTSSK